MRTLGLVCGREVVVFDGPVVSPRCVRGSLEFFPMRLWLEPGFGPDALDASVVDPDRFVA
jgi:hypothetical protein